MLITQFRETDLHTLEERAQKFNFNSTEREAVKFIRREEYERKDKHKQLRQIKLSNDWRYLFSFIKESCDRESFGRGKK